MGENRILGLRIGDFGLVASALLAVALGLAGFCVSCFVAILSLLIYNEAFLNQANGPRIDLADSYKYVALPVGVAAFVVSAGVLAALRVRRMVRG